MKRTRVAVVGAPGMMRSGLEAIVREQADFDWAGSFSSFDEAANADVIVSIDVPLETAEVVLPPVVSIAVRFEPARISSAIRAGARAALPSSSTPGEIIGAIQAAAAGLVALRPLDLDSVMVAETRHAEPVQLSPRELEVLRMLADGLANKEVAFRLGISEHTVKFHVASILSRLNASSRAEAVAIGMRNGWITI